MFRKNKIVDTLDYEIEYYNVTLHLSNGDSKKIKINDSVQMYGYHDTYIYHYSTKELIDGYIKKDSVVDNINMAQVVHYELNLIKKETVYYNKIEEYFLGMLSKRWYEKVE